MRCGCGCGRRRRAWRGKRAWRGLGPRTRGRRGLAAWVRAREDARQCAHGARRDDEFAGRREPPPAAAGEVCDAQARVLRAGPRQRYGALYSTRYSARNGNAAAQLGRSSIERRRALSLSPVCRHPRVLTSEAQPRQLCSAPQQGVSRLLVGELIVAVLRNKTKRKKKGDFCHKIQNTV